MLCEGSRRGDVSFLKDVISASVFCSFVSFLVTLPPYLRGLSLGLNH